MLHNSCKKLYDSHILNDLMFALGKKEEKVQVGIVQSRLTENGFRNKNDI